MRIGKHLLGALYTIQYCIDLHVDLAEEFEEYLHPVSHVQIRSVFAVLTIWLTLLSSTNKTRVFLLPNLRIISSYTCFWLTATCWAESWLRSVLISRSLRGSKMAANLLGFNGLKMNCILLSFASAASSNCGACSTSFRRCCKSVISTTCVNEWGGEASTCCTNAMISGTDCRTSTICENIIGSSPPIIF